MTDTLADRLRSRLDKRLAETAAGFGAASPALGRAMEDAALSSGKRFRGVLLLMAAEAAGGADPAVQARLVAILSHALGPLGLCAGQDLDLSAEKTPDGVQREQDLKTGVLFFAGLEMLAAMKGI